ncbi:hypothetical protein L9F63_025691, partial [Diploptera punctata]
KRNLIESTKEFNWKNRRIGQTKITEVVLSLRILGNSLPILRKRELSCMTETNVFAYDPNCFQNVVFKSILCFFAQIVLSFLNFFLPFFFV